MKMYLYSICISIGIMISPESLVLLGNSAGYNGSLFYLSLIIAAVLSCLCALTFFYARRNKKTITENQQISAALGKLPAASLILAARLSVTLLAATSVLVTAGFAFNEIFLYWFPNFGFAFIVLGIVLAANLAGEQWALRLQVLLVASAIIALAVVIVTGLTTSSTPALGQSPPSEISGLYAAGAILLFLGFDLSQGHRNGNSIIPATAAILTVFFLFILWGMLSREFVTISSLSQTTIPHLKTAKSIFGQSGRLLIGIVVICGAAATVNGLFWYSGKALEHLSHQQMFPTFFRNYNQHRLIFFLLAAIIGTLMMTGLAGEEELAIYYRGGLLLWLLLLGIRCLTIFLRSGSHRLSALISLATGITLVSLSAALIAMDPHTLELAFFCIAVLAAAFLFSFVWLRMARFFPQLTKPLQTEEVP